MNCNIVCLFVVFGSCVATMHQKSGKNLRKNLQNEGVIVCKTYIKPQFSLNYVEEIHKSESKVYFFNEYVIFQLKRIEVFQFYDEPETYNYVNTGYVFHDINTQSYYKYLSFSDTAALQSAFNQHDTAELVGAWNFKRGMRPNLNELFNLSDIVDTLVEDDIAKNVVKREYRVRYGTSRYPDLEKRKVILFFQVDSIPNFLTFDKEQTSLVGLPLTRVDFPTTWENIEDGFVSPRLYLEKAKLTDIEKKVFKAWADYAKKNPVK